MADDTAAPVVQMRSIHAEPAVSLKFLAGLRGFGADDDLLATIEDGSVTLYAGDAGTAGSSVGARSTPALGAIETISTTADLPPVAPYGDEPERWRRRRGITNLFKSWPQLPISVGTSVWRGVGAVHPSGPSVVGVSVATGATVEHWIGHIVDIHEGVVVAEMQREDDAVAEDLHDIEFSVMSFDERDRDLLVPGAAFTWECISHHANDGVSLIESRLTILRAGADVENVEESPFLRALRRAAGT